jgi:hypothetical protein
VTQLAAGFSVENSTPSEAYWSVITVPAGTSSKSIMVGAIG